MCALSCILQGVAGGNPRKSNVFSVPQAPPKPHGMSAASTAALQAAKHSHAHDRGPCSHADGGGCGGQHCPACERLKSAFFTT